MVGMEKRRILVVDDEESMRHMLVLLLSREGYSVDAVEDGHKALEALRRQDYDFILCDIRMPGMDGMEFLKRLRGLPEVEPTVIMMSAYGTIDTAIECMKLGAYDYIAKPFRKDEILLTLKKAEEREGLKREVLRLREEVRREYSFANMVTKSPKMQEIFQTIRKVADYDATVLITGESGTGKELVARAIHYNGRRRKGPFIPVNCGAIPQALLESELFGYIKGAFTDARRDKKGLFEEAHGGTLFLDEIGELPKELQVKLLRALEEGQIRRLGDTKPIKVDVRIIAATAKDLTLEVKEGRFREDLYYRLRVIPIHIPPLRERMEDIPLLADHFLRIYNAKTGKALKGFTSEAMRVLTSYEYPGNVRELENAIERAVILEDGDYITPKGLYFAGEGRGEGHPGRPEGLSIRSAQRELEKRLIQKALREAKGNKSKAAKLLEISYRALLYKIQEYGLE